MLLCHYVKPLSLIEMLILYVPLCDELQEEMFIMVRLLVGVDGHIGALNGVKKKKSPVGQLRLSGRGQRLLSDVQK